MDNVRATSTADGAHAEPAASLAAVVPERVWVQTVPLRFLGIAMGARMTVVRIDDQSLLVHSPAAMDRETRRAVAQLGEVSWIVAPNKLHTLYVNQCSDAFPDARVAVSPKLPQRCPEIRHDRILTDEHGWLAGAVEYVAVGGSVYMDDVVVFDGDSKTLIVADLLHRATSEDPLSFRAAARLGGAYGRPGVTLDQRIMTIHREKARRSIRRIMDWDFQRIIMCHGGVVDQDAKSAFRAAFEWLRI